MQCRFRILNLYMLSYDLHVEITCFLSDACLAPHRHTGLTQLRSVVKNKNAANCVRVFKVLTNVLHLPGCWGMSESQVYKHSTSLHVLSSPSSFNTLQGRHVSGDEKKVKRLTPIICCLTSWQFGSFM